MSTTGKGILAESLQGMAKGVAEALETTGKKVGEFVEDTGSRVTTAAENVAKGDGQAASEMKAAAQRLNSKGQVIPPGVKRLPSGRLPGNYRWAGQVYNGPGWTSELAAKYPNGVKFTDEGFPDFSPYAIKTATFEDGYEGNYTSDFTDANAQVGLDDTPDGYTWHHNEDGTTMQLVPDDLHDGVRHAGGMALKGN
jgi:hypothetical protein